MLLGSIRHVAVSVVVCSGRARRQLRPGRGGRPALARGDQSRDCARAGVQAVAPATHEARAGRGRHGRTRPRDSGSYSVSCTGILLTLNQQ